MHYHLFCSFHIYEYIIYISFKPQTVLFLFFTCCTLKFLFIFWVPVLLVHHRLWFVFVIGEKKNQSVFCHIEEKYETSLQAMESEPSNRPNTQYLE